MEIIWKTVVGSHLYGLATEDSDKDYKGIFFGKRENTYPTKSQVIGIHNFNPHEKQEFSEGEGADKVEGMLYSARYFLQLYIKGNPTLAELPFAGEKYIDTQTEHGRALMKFVRDHLITKHLFGGYIGYYNDQIKSFQTGKGKSREKRLRKGANLPPGYNIDPKLQAEFENGQEPRLGLVEQLRHALIAQGWYDGKSMSHAYRIGVQGVELFNTGKMAVTLEGDNLDIALRLKSLGEADHNHPDRISREDAIKMVVDLGRQLEDAKNNSTLPYGPDVELANKFIIDLLESYYGEYNGT